MDNAERLVGLAKLREPFKPHQIGRLPKPTKVQTEEVKRDFKKGIRCEECGAWHHPKVVHLDYVGHAALTDRLLDVDPMWSWEPVAFTPEGLPAFDAQGGLWIRLEVLGVTRLGYGNAPDKKADPGNREKEAIGDALRNAGMRFGIALDLWHKGDLHADDDAQPQGQGPRKAAAPNPQLEAARESLKGCNTADDVAAWVAAHTELPNALKVQLTGDYAAAQQRAKAAA